MIKIIILYLGRWMRRSKDLETIKDQLYKPDGIKINLCPAKNTINRFKEKQHTC